MAEYIHRNIDSELIAWKEDSMRKSLAASVVPVRLGSHQQLKNLGKQFEFSPR